MDSPTIAALHAELKQGNRAALERFWQKLAEQPALVPVQGARR